MAQTPADVRTRLKRLSDREKSLGEQHRAARAARDAAILDADDLGWSVRTIAAEIGRDIATVHHVITRGTAERQQAAEQE